MRRMLFEKTGNSVWISHLDLMRVFQRAFKRAGLPLTHTQGYNPRPSVSIALPLSVGVESRCELLDFELDGVTVSNEEIRDRLNKVLVSGVTVKEVYDGGRKLRDLSLLSCVVTLEYDAGVPDGAEDAIRQFFAQPSLIAPKKTKSGMQDQDIIPMIRCMEITAGENTLQMHARFCCQNPSLNPMQLAAAVSIHLPQFRPDHASCIRTELFDIKEKVFR